jgi:hypothetical protein
MLRGAKTASLTTLFYALKLNGQNGHFDIKENEICTYAFLTMSAFSARAPAAHPYSQLWNFEFTRIMSVSNGS